jgi:hypothetical protein
MKLYERINGPWHGRMLLILFAPILFHMSEHVTQVLQVFVLGVDRSDALGGLGVWMPDLIRSEFVHFGFSVYTLSSILLLGGGMVGLARRVGLLALAVQAWHLLEHSLLLFQGRTGTFFFGADEQTSLVQLLVPRVELHFVYNGVVFTVILIAMLLHAFPPRGEMAKPRCGCPRVTTLEAEAAAA